jgi:thioredoxin-like negative regulator of GroEL
LIAVTSVKLSFQLYEDETFIIKLNKTNFDGKVTNSSEMWIAKFYSPNCRHSVKLVPEFEKLAVEARNIFSIGALDCLSAVRICSDYDVNSFPRIAFLYKTFIVDYSGPSNSQSMLTAARIAKKDYQDFFKLKKIQKL